VNQLKRSSHQSTVFEDERKRELDRKMSERCSIDFAFKMLFGKIMATREAWAEKESRDSSVPELAAFSASAIAIPSRRH
jgi:hypothetical protein